MSQTKATNEPQLLGLLGKEIGKPVAGRVRRKAEAQRASMPVGGRYQQALIDQ